jgi:hypothetical protein
LYIHFIELDKISKKLAIMFKIRYIIIILLLSVFACDNLDISSHQAETFVKVIGTGSSQIGNDVKEFNGGYLILATVSSENENTEIVLMQTNKFGNLLPDGIDTLSSLRGGNNTASQILLTDDGGFIILGTVVDTAGIDDKNIFLEKFNSSLVSEGESIFGESEINEEGVAIKKASSGYIIAGSTDIDGDKDIYLVKLDDSRDLEWDQNHGGAGTDYSSDVIVISSGYVVIGTTNSFNLQPGQANNNIMLVETNQTGGSPDFITYGSSNNDYGESLVKLDDGGYIILGTVENLTGDNPSIYIIRAEDNIHNVLWNAQYEEALPSHGYDIIKSNGGFVIVGDIELSSGLAASFFKIDSEGEILIGNLVDESRDGLSYGGFGQKMYSVEQTSDGGYIMVGSSGEEGNEMISLIKVNSDGEL